jgi:LmbE family N-acetylglucosaminyl deacetylase
MDHWRENGQKPLFSRRFFIGALGVSSLAPFCAAAESLRIVVAGGHPGDPEYGCGGTIARYTDLGHSVTLLYLNRGEKICPASEGDAGSSVRVPEARKACEILKAKAAFAGQCDGHSIVDSAHEDEFAAVLAGEKPDILFTHWPVDGHADHRAISALSYGAWARAKKSFALYFYEVSDGEDTQMFAPTDYVDITSTESVKKAACYAHASQAPDKFYALQSAVTRYRGIESGCRQAEAFTRHSQSKKAFLP